MAEIERIADLSALDELLEQSRERPVWIFKHSLTCGTSAAAWAEFQRFAADPSGDGAVFALIEVQTARAVSTALAQRTGVLHQSPQVLLLRDARAAWHASHYQISVRALKGV
ncbi:MAG TPA: bacillithiol system redox-active protein YtxJ [Thermoanaerobaculia bacterium]|jgi:bacillithiol system protein YtxJ